MNSRYILIDNCSGYIFGDSHDLNGQVFNGTPLEYVAALEAHIGNYEKMTYETCSAPEIASNEGGYHVYRVVQAGFPVVEDGTDPETIAAVVRRFPYVTTIRCISADA